MNKNIIKSISEFAEVITGGTPSTTKPEYWGGDIPWLNSGVLNDGDIKTPSKYITELGLNNSSAKMMPKDTVLIALTGATTGQVGYLTFAASANQSVTGILPSKEHHPRFLYYFLKTQRQKIQGDAFGGAQPHINQKYVKDFKVPLPLLDDQIRVAHLLGKVVVLIAQRKRNLQQLDDLLKSVFLEMFGDPVRNQKGWDVISWDNLFSTRTGKLNANAMSDNGEYPFFTCAKKIYKIEFYAFDCEALILAGNNATADYDVKYYKGKFNAYQRTYILELKDRKDNYRFYQHHLEMKLLQLKDGSKGANTRYLTKQFLDTLFFIKPDEAIQNRFAAIVEKVEGIKSRYQQSLTELENLYGALSQKAFKGELELSRIEVKKEVDVMPDIAERVASMKRDSKKELERIKSHFAAQYSMSSPEQRQRLLRKFLDEFLENAKKKNEGVSIDEGFWSSANFNSLDYMDDDDKPFGLAEYEQLKSWIFEMLESGKQDQDFAESDNKIRLKAKG